MSKKLYVWETGFGINIALADTREEAEQLIRKINKNYPAQCASPPLVFTKSVSYGIWADVYDMASSEDEKDK